VSLGRSHPVRDIECRRVTRFCLILVVELLQRVYAGAAGFRDRCNGIVRLMLM
jgi:hypothetical protein